MLYNLNFLFRFTNSQIRQLLKRCALQLQNECEQICFAIRRAFKYLFKNKVENFVITGVFSRTFSEVPVHIDGQQAAPHVSIPDESAMLEGTY